MCCVVKSQVFLKCLYRNMSYQLIKGRQKPGDIQAEKALGLRTLAGPTGRGCAFPLLTATSSQYPEGESCWWGRRQSSGGKNHPGRKEHAAKIKVIACTCTHTNTCAGTHICSSSGRWIHYAVLHYAVLNSVCFVGFDWIVLKS